MTLLGGVLLVLAVIAVCLAMLATWALLRDPTINTAGRIARIVMAWLLPIGGPLSLLRSISELSAESLPPRGLLRPFAWLLFVTPRVPNALAAEDDYPSGSTQRDND